MNEAFEYNGVWRLPETPDEQIHGQLKYTPENGVVLELLGTLDGSLHSGDTAFNPPLVLGLSDLGKRITLSDCQLSHIKGSFAGFDRSLLDANIAFIGVHFNSTEEIRFKSLAVHYAHLDEWVNRTGFDVDRSEFSRGKLTVRYERPERVKMRVGDYEIHVVTIANVSENFVQPTMTIAQKAWIGIFSERRDRLKTIST